jgi:hypothetical protein
MQYKNPQQPPKVAPANNAVSELTPSITLLVSWHCRQVDVGELTPLSPVNELTCRPVGCTNINNWWKMFNHIKSKFSQKTSVRSWPSLFFFFTEKQKSASGSPSKRHSWRNRLRWGWKGSKRINTLAYFLVASVYRKKSF